MIKVFGHLNPDTDSTCSPIVYSWYLRDIKGIESQPVLWGHINKEAEFVLEYFQVEKPFIASELLPGEEVVIVDTNNPDELPETIQNARIIEIVDHHKLFGGLSTSEPINITLRPLACTATVIWQLIDNETVIPREIAGLMLAAIISDTLKFTSPTTTQDDLDAANELSKLIGEDIDALAESMFEAKSDLSGMSAKDLLIMDSKVFTFGGKKIRISSIETTNPTIALGMKNGLEKSMEEMKQVEGLDGAFLFIVDIINGNATLVIPSNWERRVAEKAFDQAINATTILYGVVSRKKQIAPALERALAN